MDISIANFRNIENIELTIEDGRINYLFGVCGSGKSSILDALSRPVKTTDVSVGHNIEESSVSVNGSAPSYENTAQFGLSQQNVLFSRDETEEAYYVFVGDESKLRALEASFDESIESLRSIREELLVFRGMIEDLGRAIGTPSATGYTPKSKLGKAQAALVSATPVARKTIDGKSTEYLDWKAKGFTVTTAFDEGTCPFCEETLTSQKHTELEDFRDIALKDLKPILKSTTLLSDLGIKEPDYEDEKQFDQFKEKLQELFEVKAEIGKVIDFCNAIRDPEILHKVPRGIEVNDIAYKYVPDLKPLVEDVNKRQGELTAMLGEMSAAFKALVEVNAKQLNRMLRTLDVPYAFSINVADRGQHRASYVLRHIQSDGAEDMRECLSYGERNLISLLLFLHNNDSQVLLIDDPASSYDDFRRSQIYRCIKAQAGKTILVVSHDQAFIRRAVCDESSDVLGAILILENAANGCRLKKLSKHSFVYLDDAIRSRITEAGSYFQKMINVRLFCEIHKSELADAAWGYSSAILHGVSKCEINSNLDALNTDEAEVVSLLTERIGTAIDPMPDSYERTPDGNYSDYELLILAREELSKQKADGVISKDDIPKLEMLNDLVHMNDCALFCLNPYEYAVWSTAFSDIVAKYRELA